MAKYRLSQLAKIAVSSSDSPSVFTNISNVTTINESGAQRSEIDVTNLDSTAMEYAPGLVDFGSMTFEVNWDPLEATHVTLDSIFLSGAVRDWRITESPRVTPPTGETTYFKGYVSALTKTRAVNQVVKASVTIRVTGATNITY